MVFFAVLFGEEGKEKEKVDGYRRLGREKEGGREEEGREEKRGQEKRREDKKREEKRREDKRREELKHGSWDMYWGYKRTCWARTC